MVLRLLCGEALDVLSLERGARPHPYTGPCPPRGATHRDVFRVVALDTPLDTPLGATAAAVERALQGHTIAAGKLTGTYAR